MATTPFFAPMGGPFMRPVPQATRAPGEPRPQASRRLIQDSFDGDLATLP